MSNLFTTLLQRKCFKNRINTPRPSSWVSGPHLALMSPSLQAFIFVTSLCSQHQGQHAQRKVWFSCLGFYHFLLPWPDFDVPLFWGELEQQEQGVISSKQNRLSEPLTFWSKELSHLLPMRKHGGTWSLISKENKRNWRFNYKLTDSKVEPVFGFTLFRLFL